MTPLEYIAGFFDGEGSIGIYRNGRKTLHLRTQLTQNINSKTRPLMHALRDSFGGNLAPLNGGRAVNWQLNGDGAAVFLESILPHLVIKKDQAELAICWQRSRPKPQRDERGRMLPFVETDADREVAERLKAMKDPNP